MLMPKTSKPVSISYRERTSTDTITVHGRRTQIRAPRRAHTDDPARAVAPGAQQRELKECRRRSQRRSRIIAKACRLGSSASPPINAKRALTGRGDNRQHNTPPFHRAAADVSLRKVPVSFTMHVMRRLNTTTDSAPAVVSGCTSDRTAIDGPLFVAQHCPPVGGGTTTSVESW